MAQVKIWKSEVEQGLLPPVCMVCGADTDLAKPVKFAWVPWWVILLFFVSPLIWLIVALLLRKSMTIEAPVCERHVRHWLWRKVIPITGLLVSLGGLSLGIVLLATRPKDDLSGSVLVVSAACVLIVVVLAALLGSTGVRPNEITHRTITLIGVSQEFADVLEDERDRDEEEEEREYREWKARKAARRSTARNDDDSDDR